MMDDTINRRLAIKTALEFFVEFFGGAFREDDQRLLAERIEELPSTQPERHLTCKNCIHLGHAYMMPCKNCKRNQMLPDWYKVETERREDE